MARRALLHAHRLGLLVYGLIMRTALRELRMRTAYANCVCELRTGQAYRFVLGIAVSPASPKQRGPRQQGNKRTEEVRAPWSRLHPCASQIVQGSVWRSTPTTIIIVYHGYYKYYIIFIIYILFIINIILHPFRGRVHRLGAYA